MRLLSPTKFRASACFHESVAVECLAEAKGGPIVVTANCIDPLYSSPIFLSETDETEPVPHHRISGHFNGTGIEFSIYLPPQPQWEGRFFQLLYPTQTSKADDYAIIFGVESGGYTIQASGSIGYRADAALAKLSRQVASKYYNDTSTRIYGYIYGGSGGSLKAIGAAENTFGIWDGCVALVQATPMSIPYNWGIRALGGLALANRSAELIDTISPGSNKDPESVLSELEQAVLEETTALGVPPRGWEDWSGIAENRTQLFQTLQEITIPMIQQMDPSYSNDFWTREGYAGTDQSALGELFRAALMEFNSTIESAVRGQDNVTTDFVLRDVPDDMAGVVGLGFSVVVNNVSHPFSGRLDFETRTVHILPGPDLVILKSLVHGANIQIDNRWYLATHTYHRHQVPPAESSFYGYDFLRDGNGNPSYPQRQILLGPLISRSTTGGATHTGNITMKMFAMNNLLDYDALPWHADWYKNQVLKSKGGLEDHYRLYYSDNADHLMGPIKAPSTSRVIEFIGLYQQHLRDLSAWAEQGINPPPPVNYTISNGQINLPKAASERQGIQPVVDLTVCGSKRVHVRPGESVEFIVTVQVPNGLGQVVALEWDPIGVGAFAKKNFVVGNEVGLQFAHSFNETGVYFAGIRAASHREGNTETGIALAWNLDRVRVVVE